MTRAVECSPETLDPIVWSEISRGNRGGDWVTQPPSETAYHFRYPIDLEAIRAEFDLPDCLKLVTWPDGRTAVGCELTRLAVGGGPQQRGWSARRSARQWWQAWERGSHTRIVIGGAATEEK